MRKFTWRRDLPDFRDFHYGAHIGARTAASLPGKVDLRPQCPPVADQGELGSCTAFAVLGALEYLYRPDGAATFSKLFTYYNERLLEHTVSYDSGATLRDGIKTLSKQGACAEDLWPYDIAKFRRKPPQTCYDAAQASKISGYYRINSLLELKSSLADGFPVAFGLSCFESFISATVESTGVVPYPDRKEAFVGGHATVAVGYDAAQDVVICRNSWGPSWGQAGYYTMPYAYVKNPNLASDFWSMRK